MAVNVSTVITSVWPALGALLESTAVFWDATEMYAWANDLMRRFRDARIYVETTPYTLTSGQQAYSLPAKATALLGVTYANTFLPRYTPREIDALRQAWRTYSASVAPEGVVEGASSDNTFSVFPSPTATLGEMLAITVSLPADASAVAPTLPLPTWMAEVVYLGLVAGARGRDSDGAMPEVAASIERVIDAFRQTAQSLYVAGK